MKLAMIVVATATFFSQQAFAAGEYSATMLTSGAPLVPVQGNGPPRISRSHTEVCVVNVSPSNGSGGDDSKITLFIGNAEYYFTGSTNYFRPDNGGGCDGFHATVQANAYAEAQQREFAENSAARDKQHMIAALAPKQIGGRVCFNDGSGYVERIVKPKIQVRIHHVSSVLNPQESDQLIWMDSKEAWPCD